MSKKGSITEKLIPYYDALKKYPNRTPSETVAAAAADGVTLDHKKTKSLIQRLRIRARERGEAVPAPKPSARGRLPSRRTPEAWREYNWVKEHDDGSSAEYLSSKAKADGLDMSATRVNTHRSAIRRDKGAALLRRLPDDQAVVAFMAKHSRLSVSQILLLASEEGLSLSKDRAYNIRRRLEAGEAATPTPTTNGAPKPKRAPDVDRVPHTARAAKIAQLRALIFDVGFDTARTVMDEFSAVQEGLSQPRRLAKDYD